jgi:hypothetical protein
MSHIYRLFSVVGWSWAVVVFAVLLFFKVRSSSDEKQH